MAEPSSSIAIDRRDTNIVKTIIAGIVSPLIVAVVLGYITLYSTITRLTLLVEQSDKRLTLTEQDYRRHEVDYRDLQILVVKQTQLLETLYKEITLLKEDHRAWARK